MSILIEIRWERKGECDYKACKAICCRSFTSSGELKNENDHDSLVTVTEGICEYVNSIDSKCDIYNKQPSTCREFPLSPWDIMYRRVSEKCSYWFEIEIRITELDVSPITIRG